MSSSQRSAPRFCPPVERSARSFKRSMEAVLLEAFPKLHQRLRRMQAKAWRRKLDPILNQEGKPDTSRAEADFHHLQAYREQPDEYGYGPHDVWKRGVERAGLLVQRFSMQSPGFDILEVGCGDGMTSSLLAGYGHKVTMTDLDDWRDRRMDASVRFVRGALEEGLDIESGRFDLVFSYNTFEHVRDPVRVLHEMLKWCRPGGFVYLDFGPLFASPWGLHAYRTLHMPYPQFLFSEVFIHGKLRELGIRDLGVERDELQPLNRWRLAQFRQACEKSGGELVWRDASEILRHLPVIRQYPEAFRGHGLVFEDVTTALLKIIIQKQKSGGTIL